MAVEQVHDNSKFEGVRLPTNIKPTHYDLFLKPNLDDFTFDGTVSIKYIKTVTEDVTEVVLNAEELKIIEGHSDGNKILNKVTYSEDSGTATLSFDKSLSQSGTIVLKFKGVLNDKLKGFYRTSFKIDDETVYAATTQFEAIDARRCFPCWDEPAVKATFSVTLCYNRWLKVGDKKIEMISLSNTPVLSQDGEEELTVKFKETPIMSTYLLAFIIGPFECIEGNDGIRPVRVYTTPGKKEQGRFALDVACKSLRYYEKYFDIPYPLEKMDLIAIPDFAAGAMENWGLVTYRETCLLVDGENTSTMRKQYVALVVAHELAHQWFGNLVTMEWWTHLWLNEGFATFMEFLCVDHMFPQYDIWSQFTADYYGRALDLDSLHNSHPIEVPINHPNEVDEIFDAISYNKGSAIIRMLYNYIGDDCFRKGMKEYLTKFAYKNAITEDLWNSLEAASNKPVQKIMACWTSQKGFPWLSVCHSSQEGDKVRLELKQEKFTADGKLSEQDKSAIWSIPIITMNGSNLDKRSNVSIMDSKTSEIMLEGVGDNWIKLNPGSIGLYRTAYPDDIVEKLRCAIFNQTLPAMDRFELLDDFFALCQAGKVSTVSLLKMLDSFKTEVDYSVWSSISSCVGHLGLLLSHTDFIGNFNAFGRNLFSDIYSRLTWTPKENEKETDTLTRALVISRLVSLEHKEVIEQAIVRYDPNSIHQSQIPADLRSSVYKSISIYGDDTSFNSLMNLYVKSDSSEEKNRVGMALGSTKDPNRLKKVIDFALSKEVRSSDFCFFIMPIGMNNPHLAWNLFKEHENMFKERFQAANMLSKIIKCCTQNFASEERAQEVEKFFEENKTFPTCTRSIQQALETIRLNANWLSRDSVAIKTFLSTLKLLK